MPDAITLQPNRLGDVMTNQFKSGVTDPLDDVAFASREVVIKANHLLPSLHQAINQMGAEETGPSSHQIDQRLIPINRWKLPRLSWFSSLRGT